MPAEFRICIRFVERSGAIRRFALSASPLAPGSSSTKPSSKCDLPSAPSPEFDAPDHVAAPSDGLRADCERHIDLGDIGLDHLGGIDDAVELLLGHEAELQRRCLEREIVVHRDSARSCDALS